ncbi:MAG: sodium-independent anion transporter, partial [Sphingomonadales bacterium]|nr:sodium-independent anion transporter [Sphingomonadales bacterium]
HLSEVKGPVMDRLQRSHFLEQLSGKVFLSQNAAYSALIAIADTEDNADNITDDWMARGLI